MRAKGFQLGDTLFFLTISNLGPLVGPLIASSIVDRLERRFALAFCASMLIVSGFVFTFANTPLLLMVGLTSFLLVASIYVLTLSMYAAEVFRPPAVLALAHRHGASIAWPRSPVRSRYFRLSRDTGQRPSTSFRQRRCCSA